MAEGDGFGGQNVCNIVASFVNQRESMQRLLALLSSSQEICSDTNCIDEFSDLSSQTGGPLSTGPSDAVTDSFTFVLFLVIASLTILFLGIGRNAPLPEGKRNNDRQGPGDHSDDDNQQRLL